MATTTNRNLVTQLPAPPPRPDDAHKGTFGSALIIGGSRGMSGAAALAGLAALRGGAGLVWVAVPESILPIVASLEASYLTVPLPEDADGRLSRAARDRLGEILPNHTAVAVGPGWGQSDELLELARWLYTTTDRPLVVDADGLNALACIRDLIAGVSGPRVLTPHPGEFARLIGSDTKTVQADRENLALRFAAEHQVVLVLKGFRSIITDGARLAINTTGNSGMATGGSGDVLTGLITALLAQGMEPFEAAHLGAHLHGLAGDLAADELSKPGLIASDLPWFLGAAWRSLGE